MAEPNKARGKFHHVVARGSLAMKCVVLATSSMLVMWAVMQCVYFVVDEPNSWLYAHKSIAALLQSALEILCAPRVMLLYMLLVDAFLVVVFAFYTATYDESWDQTKARSIWPTYPHRMLLAANRATSKQETPHRIKYRIASFGWLFFFAIMVWMLYFSSRGFE